VTLNLIASVQEGIIMCADSMVTLKHYDNLQQEITTTFEHAEKLIELSENYAAAAMISGDASIGNTLISELLKEAGRNLATVVGPPTEADVISAVVGAIDAEYAIYVTQYKQSAALFYSDPTRLAEINLDRQNNGRDAITGVSADDVSVIGLNNNPANPIVTIAPPSTFTVVLATYLNVQSALSIDWPGAHRNQVVPPDPLRWWGSAGTALSRLVLGFDLPLLTTNQGDLATAATLAFATTNNVREEYQMPTPIGSMPLQDAIHFVEYLGQVACGYDKFTSGPAGVGGELDVLYLTRGKKEWAHRKRFHSSLPTRYTV